MGFTFIDLFAGVGGFRFALESLNGTCVFSSEIDKFAAKSYEAIYGDKPTGDITEVDAKDVPDHDVLVGGFPCQSFSQAGLRKGFDDVRGTLFFDIARIAEEKRPKALLLENVKGLVNHDKGNTLDTMIQLLNDIGYVVDFDVLNSKYFGVPQNRERIFIVAIREDLVVAEPFSEVATTGNTVVPKGKRRIGEWANVFNFDFPRNDAVTSRLRDVLEAEVDEKYYLSDDKTAKLVAQLEDVSTEPTLFDVSQARGEGKARIYKDVAPTITARDYKEPRLIGREETDKPNMLGLCDIKGNDAIRRVYGSDGVSPTLTTMQGGHQEPKIAEEGIDPRYRIRKLTPLECFRLQAFPDSVHQTLVDAGISDSQRYKMAGNAVTVNVVHAIAERLLPLIMDD